MYCVYGNTSWYIDCCPLYGRCPLLGVSVIGGSTVCAYMISFVLCAYACMQMKACTLTLPCVCTRTYYVHCSFDCYVLHRFVRQLGTYKCLCTRIILVMLRLP